MYLVIGLEIFKFGEVMGVHTDKKTALEHAKALEFNKNEHICQTYKVLTNTDVKKQKITLY